jgi:hypothetical protein
LNQRMLIEVYMFLMMQLLLQLRTRIRFVLLVEVKAFLDGLINCILFVLFIVVISN